MGNRWSAGGCKCCGCACPNPAYPSTWTIGDGLGAHTLTYHAVGSGYWQAATTMTVDGYAVKSNTDTTCVFCHSYAMTVIYKLTLTCPVGATPGSWKLEVFFEAVACDPGTGTVVKYGSNAVIIPGGFGCSVALGVNQVSVSDTIALDPCNVSLLTFNIPTTYSGLAVPGGGGILTATP